MLSGAVKPRQQYSSASVDRDRAALKTNAAKTIRRFHGDLRKSGQTPLLTRSRNRTIDYRLSTPSLPRSHCGNDAELSAFLSQYPETDHAQLRALVRNATRAAEQDRTRAVNKLIRALQQAMQAKAGPDQSAEP